MDVRVDSLEGRCGGTEVPRNQPARRNPTHAAPLESERLHAQCRRDRARAGRVTIHPLPMKSLCIFVLTLAGSLAAAEPARTMAEFEWPAETGTYKPGKGVELAQALCTNCH